MDLVAIGGPAGCVKETWFGNLGIGRGGFMSRYISCLLYTSPSPRDQRGSRMPSSA